MKKKLLATLAFAAIGISGCSITPAKVVKLKQVPAGTEAAEVVIYREPVLMNTRAAKAIIGLDGKDILELKNAQYTKLSLPHGNYDLYIRSDQADKENHINLSLNKNTCLKVAPKPFTTVLFRPAFIGSLFDIKEDVCLDESNISKYELVPFVYDNEVTPAK